MKPKFTLKQMMSGDMDDAEFAAWFCFDIMRPHLPDQWIDLGPDVCKTFATNGRKYCFHFGIQRPDLQAQYIYLMWVLAPNMHEVPAISAILNSSMAEDEKIETLFDVHDSVAEQALANSDMTHWYPEEVPGNVLGIEVEDLSDMYDEFPFLDPASSQSGRA